MNIPRTITRIEKYQEFIIKGGSKNELPKPITRLEKFWFYIANKRR